MSITDEIRHKAWNVFTNCKSEFISDKLKAVLEAVEPMILAPLQAENRALRNFAVVAEERMETFTNELAKRQELDPQ
jgi:hypothetical protein